MILIKILLYIFFANTFYVFFLFFSYSKMDITNNDLAKNDFDIDDIDDDDIYSDNDITSKGLEIVDIEMNPTSKKKSNLPPKRWIIYHLVINTNQRKPSMDPAKFDLLWNRMKSASTIFFEKYFSKLYSLVDVKSPGNFKDVPLQDRILSGPKVEFVREIGPKRGLLHIHIMVKWSVRALNIQLNRVGIEKVWAKLLGLNSLYVHIKKFNDANSNLIDYIRKTLYDDL